MGRHSKALAAEKKTSSPALEKKKKVNEEDVVQREMNPVWHSLATSVDKSNPDTGESASNIARFPDKIGAGNNPVQRACAECREERETAHQAIQKKVTVGAPDDDYEREADTMADKVMRMPATGRDIKEDEVQTKVQAKPLAAGKEPLAVSREPLAVSREPLAINKKPLVAKGTPPADNITPINRAKIQSKCEGDSCSEEETVQAKIELPTIPNVEQSTATEEDAPELPQTGEEAAEADAGEGKKEGGATGQVGLPPPGPRPQQEEAPIQTKFATGTATPAPDSLQNDLNRSKGGGSPLGESERRHMESGFGRDFGQVRVHTDSNAAQMNRDVGARAFTHGNDIYFNAGQYRPGSQDGRRLLAHELTHTVQQGSNGGTVQRHIRPEDPSVSVEGRAERPNDGAEVEGRMSNKIDNDPDVQEGEDLDEEERAEKENPDRGEVREDSSALNSSGESSPAVDRGAAAQEKTQAQKELIDQQVEAQPAEQEGEEGEEGGEQQAELSAAEQAAQRAQAAEQQAQTIEIPAAPAPFRQPRIDAPVDSAGEALPRNAQIDTQVRGLGYIGEMLRQKGYELKRHAAEQTIGAWGNEAVLEQTREDLANAVEGTATLETHNTERKGILEKSKGAHQDSTERQQFVSEKAPDFASKADEGKEDSSALAVEASSKAEQSESEIPDDPDARADAEQQSGEMSDTSQGAASMDQAITQTGERARQYQRDAEQAGGDNQQGQAHIEETQSTIEQTDTRVAEMHGTNAASQGQIDAAAQGPAQIRQFADHSARSGDELIAATIVMEQELQDIQEQYLTDMAAIESREDAEQRLREEAERNAQPPEMPEDEQRVVQLHGMSDDEQAATIDNMNQEERDGLLAAITRMISRTPDRGTDATEGARIQVNTGGSKALGDLQGMASEFVIGEDASRAIGLSQAPPDPRQQQIQAVEGTRIQRVGGVLDVADQNMNFLSEEQQRALANRLVAQSITDDIGNINVLQMGKQMLLGMVNPVMALQGVVGGFDKVLSGLANIGNWDAWQRDPLGNLLQIAADVSTGLAMIFSSVLGIAAIITALMVILTIVSWGTLSPVTGPVIGWMGTVMTYAGWGAIISGGLSVYFNYLSYIKNLHDAGTAESARELLGNTEQMRQNANDGFTGAMAVVEGVSAVKMGPRLSGGDFFANVPRSPGAWARQTADGIRSGAGAVARAPGRLAAGVRNLFSGGRQGLMRFKDRLQGLFQRRRPGADPDLGPPTATRPRADVDAPQPTRPRDAETGPADASSRQTLDEARGQRLDDMDPPHRRAEMDELANNQPRRVDPDSPHAERYDIEIHSNGHTYRRNKPPRRGWCRFSARECGIPEGELPQNVQQRVGDIDSNIAAEAAATPQQIRTGRQQATANGWPGDAELPPGYQWVSGPDGRPVLRNKPGNGGPRREFDPDAPADAPLSQRFPERPSTRGPRLRDEYLGATPGKRSRTGREVIERMRGETPPRGGKIRGTEPNELVYVPGPPDGQARWYPVDEMDMGHLHDAVTYWNNTGRNLGPRHPQVREWMLDPGNYALEHRSINRSRGSILGQTQRYLPPA